MECGDPVKTDVLVLEASTLPRGCLKMLSPGTTASGSVAHKFPGQCLDMHTGKKLSFILAEI